jgi:hypothetical protein
MKKISLIFIIVGVLSVNSVVYARDKDKAVFPGFAPGHSLYAPVTENIDLSGKNYLEFRWRRGQFTNIRYYILKIYKGYNTYAADRIFMEHYYANRYSAEIPAGLFEKDGVYTWTLQEVFYSGRKGDASLSSFIVIDK